MTEVNIRAVADADKAAWLPLWRGYQTFYKVDLPQAATDTLWARMLDPAEPVYGALAWNGGEAVGLVHWLTHRFTWTPEDLCYINDLFVAPALRVQGVGRKLIGHVYDVAPTYGCTQVYWLTHETNTTGQALYNRVAVKTGFIHYSHKLG